MTMHLILARRPSRPPRAPVGALGSRLARIHAMQSRSLPASTSAAITADFTSGCSGLMIADVIPAPMAMARNVPVTTCRLGRPKLMFDAPQVVFTLSSSRSRRIRLNACWPAWPRAPIGITSGSTTTSADGMPWSAARSTILRATAKRTSMSSLIPVSSLEMATTAAP